MHARCGAHGHVRCLLLILSVFTGLKPDEG
jgi:hypothetical protein